MPAKYVLSFSDEGKARLVASGNCTQTIRPSRSREAGDTVHLWFRKQCPDRLKLGIGVVAKVTRKQFKDITEQEFLDDGFKGKEEAWHWFFKTYKSRLRRFARQFKKFNLRPENVLGEMEFEIINWIPIRYGRGWKPSLARPQPESS